MVAPPVTAPPAAPRAGLSLCGGGIAAAMYHVGCVAALEDALEGASCNDFGAYVGTAAGAVVAAGLAGAVGIQRVYRAMLDPADDFFPLERRHLFRFDSGEWRRLVASAALALRGAALGVVTRPAEFDLWRELDRFYDSLPAGISNLDAYEAFLESVFARRGVPNRFDAMPRRLLVPATDLDAGERVVFGAGAFAHVPVARAICASSAAPILFAPVRVGDRDCVDGYGWGEHVAHLDLLADAGADVLFVVAPLVPVRADPDARRIPTGHGPMPRVRDKGFMGVYSQAERMSARARLRHELERSAREAPERVVVLLAPDPADATLFFHPPMSFAARRALLRYGYDRTAAQLRREAPRLGPLLAARGLALRG